MTSLPWTRRATSIPGCCSTTSRRSTFEPDFATNWTLSNNGRSWTFTTVPGAEWSDGKPLTAQDAAWTIATMVRLRVAPRRSGRVRFTALSVRGRRTRQQSSSRTRSRRAMHWPTSSRSRCCQNTSGRNTPSATARRSRASPTCRAAGHPVVSGGPFIFVKYTYDEAIVFARNPHYYGTPAHIAGFGVELFSNDDALVAAMRAGEIDAATGDPNLPPTDVRPLREGGFRIVAEPAVAYNDLIINTNPKKTDHRELLNPNVRKAFEYAMDRNTIDKVAFLGYAQPAQSIIPPATGKWYDPAVKPLPYSLAKANALLDAAGYERGPGRDPDRRRPSDVLHRLCLDRQRRRGRSDRRDHDERLREDRREAELPAHRRRRAQLRHLRRPLPQVRPGVCGVGTPSSTRPTSST